MCNIDNFYLFGFKHNFSPVIVQVKREVSLTFFKRFLVYSGKFPYELIPLKLQVSWTILINLRFHIALQKKSRGVKFEEGTDH